MNNIEVSAVVGVAFSNDVFYNYIEDDGDFKFTGMNIVEMLQEQRNEFVADIMASQSYHKIGQVYADYVEFTEFKDSNNSNVASYEEMYHLMENELGPFDYYYIYDYLRDLLIVKTPYTKPMALDYKNNVDVEYFLEYLNNAY